MPNFFIYQLITEYLAVRAGVPRVDTNVSYCHLITSVYYHSIKFVLFCQLPGEHTYNHFPHTGTHLYLWVRRSNYGKSQWLRPIGHRCHDRSFGHTTWAQFTEAWNYVLTASVFLGLAAKFGFCVCVLHVTRHSTLTRLAQKFGACTLAGNHDRKRRIRRKQSHETGPW